MSQNPILCQKLHRHGGVSDDKISLTYDARFLRRKVLVSDAGLSILIDFAKTTSLENGDLLELENGTRIEVIAAPEALLEIRGDLTRLAWHIGNRHTPCEIKPDHLLIQNDHVIRDMLGKLGAQVVEIKAPFTPEGGAYGMGRTHGHDHSHAH